MSNRLHVAINGWFWDRPTTGSGQYTRRLVEGLRTLAADEVKVTLICPPETDGNLGKVC